MTYTRFDNITKSEEDKRLYRGLILNNEMKVLLVSDSSSDKAAAAMDINVGYMSDPKHLMGLAHFCEHMLFLGTKKYPNENDYNKFLSEHGGCSNAATHPDHTTYYFDVVPEHLPAALDRFAQFFIAPLFTESATDKELNAVNSEHEKNVQSDIWRLDQLDKFLANENHPYHTFGTGNKYTLQTYPSENGINVRDELLKFHEKWYSANLMSLAVLGKESLDELEELVTSLFEPVKNKKVDAPVWEEHPFTEKQFSTCTYVKPVKDIRNLNIVFPCPDTRHLYKTAPSSYLSHLLGHEGPGSILSVLKNLGWSSSLVAGSRPSPRGFGFFAVVVDLTEEGMEHVNDIIALIFQYINLIKKEGITKWIFDENAKIGKMIFRFKDKESPRNYISTLVHYLQEYPLDDALTGPYLVSDWQPELIKDILNNFTPNNIRVAVLAKNLNVELDSEERWYGTKFKTEPIKKSVLDYWNGIGLHDELKIPERNSLIPDNFDLYPNDDDINDLPQIIEDNALMRVWFKQDDIFKLPKANLMFDFVSPLAYMDPLNCNLTHMFVQLFRDALNEYAYAAELAGLKYELINTKYGLILAISGYNDKQPIFLENIFDKLVNFKIIPKKFEIYKENYIRNLNNFNAEQPYQHAVYYLAVLLTEHSWTKNELLAATEQLSPELLESFIPQMLSRVHIETLFHGNINKKLALELTSKVNEKMTNSFKISPLLSRQLLLNRELKLEKNCNYMYEVQNHVHKPSCIELYYQCGLQSTESNALLELLANIIQEPCFNTLRTKEQLGYIVFSGIRKSNGVQGLRVIVQSDKHPQYLDERIESFIEEMETYIKDMDNEEFKRHRESLALQKLEKPKQLGAHSTIFWSEITSQQYHFKRAEVEVSHLRTLDKESVLEYYRNYIKIGAPNRKKLSINVISMAEDGAGKTEENKFERSLMPTVIKDITSFKSSHEMFPLVQPYINISRKGNRCKIGRAHV